MMNSMQNTVGAGLLLALMSSQCLAAAGLAVTDINPKINYSTCVSTNPLTALTDGRIAEQRSWLGANCMAWSVRQNVTALLKVSGTSGDRTIKISGTHDPKAEVTPPGFVDVFVGTDANRLKFFSRVQVDQPGTAGRYDVLVNAPSTATVIALNMFVPGRHLALTEIALAPATQANPAQANQPPRQETTECIWNECVKVSAVISSTDMSATVPSAVANPTTDPNAKSTFGWIANRFASIGTNVATTRSLDISREAGETVRYPFYIPTATSFSISINGKAASAASLSLWKAERIVAANRASVPDKLIPLDVSSPRCTETSGCILWLSVPSKSLKAGANLIEVSSGSSEKIQLSVQLADASSSSSPYLINGWSYRHDPVWNGISTDTYLTTLRDFKIDFMVVSPREVPQPGAVTAGISSAFVNTLKGMPSDKKILLFLGWGGSYGPAGKWYKDIVNSKQEQATFSAWLDQLIGLMNKAGIPPEQWYIYPIDEPTAPELNELRTIATLSKQKNPRVRLFTTIDHADTSQDATNARAIISDFDFVQIKSTLMDRTDLNFGKKANLFVYSVPSSPAKALPAEYYWSAASKPAAAGFAGAGVWSISDSGGSDPNNDFDGRFPDYTLLYRHNNQVVPSVRLMGFLDGVQDARWLKSHPTVVAPADITYQKMETLRKGHNPDDSPSPPSAPLLIDIQ